MHRLDHGTLEERNSVHKSFDPRLSAIGNLMAYKTGEKIGELFGREKEFLIVCSPYRRCLETAEQILCGMVQKSIVLYDNKIFVEDSLRESQEIKNVKLLENYNEIDFVTEPKIIYPETAYNTLGHFK